jgi:hypothetical protein
MDQKPAAIYLPQVYIAFPAFVYFFPLFAQVDYLSLMWISVDLYTKATGRFCPRK